MADSPAFDFVCSQLEDRTTFDRLEARGTVRLALRQSGFEARNIQPQQMKVVVEKVLPQELATRGIDQGDAICRELASSVGSIEASATSDSPDTVFARLGGRS